jgi:hypothetical protein
MAQNAKSLDGVLVKKAHARTRYTEKEVEELKACANPDTGAKFFMDNFFYIQHPTKGKLLFQPFEFQERLVESYHNYRFNINMLPRQTGKSTTAAGYLLWYAMFNPDVTVLIAAHKYAGAQEIMHRIRYAYEDCPDHIRCGVTSYNKGSMEFDNGSRIVSQTTTDNTGRGMSISLLYCDEFAFVNPTIAKEFWTAISPTLATGGKAIITSTPNSDEDQFALIWTEAMKRFDEHGNDTEVGINGFFAFSAHWSEHPDRDEKWAEEEKSRIGEERFRREHECEFLIFDETLINSVKLAELEGKDPIRKMGQTRWYKEVNPNYTYIVSMDPSLGTGGDYAAIQVFELPSFEQVAEWQHNNTPIQGQIRVLGQITKTIMEDCQAKSNTLPQVYYSVENNTIGEAALVAINEYGEENIYGMFLSEPARKGHVRKFRKGFNTTHKTKISACAKFKQLLETGQLKIYSKPLISELKAFVAHGTTFGAKTGEHDDLVMSTMLNVRMQKILADWDPAIYEKMRDAEVEDTVLPMPVFVSF